MNKAKRAMQMSVRLIRTIKCIPVFMLAGIVVFGNAAHVHAATLLPPAALQFADANGAPLVGGSISFYIPGTTVPKDTCKDAGCINLNTNPVILDGAGRAVIYGTGAYRQIVKDASGNLVYDQLTSDTSSAGASWAGVSGGTANAQTGSAANFTSADGQSVGFIASLTPTGPFTFNGINVLKDTPSGPLSLTGGEFAAGDVVQLTYDATAGAFHIVNLPPPSNVDPFAPIAAATTTDLGSVVRRNITITGASTITSFGSSASTSNPIYRLIFSGADTLTYNSTSLILPGNASILTAANDSADAVYLGSGKWQITRYTIAANSIGTPPGAVMAFNLATCPISWKAADGTNGTPDMRGYFVRGLDTGGTVDPSRTLASTQQDTLKDHTHTQNGANTLGTTGTFASSNGGTSSTIVGGGVSSPNNGGTETRPKNVALLYCQKS